MILQEFCELLNLSEKTVVSNFRRTKERLLDKGISIYKEGRGSLTYYEIEELIPGAIANYKKNNQCRHKNT